MAQPAFAAAGAAAGSLVGAHQAGWLILFGQGALASAEIRHPHQQVDVTGQGMAATPRPADVSIPSAPGSIILAPAGCSSSIGHESQSELEVPTGTNLFPGTAWQSSSFWTCHSSKPPSSSPAWSDPSASSTRANSHGAALVLRLCRLAGLSGLEPPTPLLPLFRQRLVQQLEYHPFVLRPSRIAR